MRCLVGFVSVVAACALAGCVDQDSAAISEQARTPWAPWQSVAGGVAGPGVNVAAMPTGGTLYSLFVMNGGNLYTANGSPHAGFGAGWSFAGNGAAASTTIAALPIGFGQAAMFVVGANGGVLPSTGSAAAGWHAWPRIGTLAASAGTSVAVVPNGGGQFTLFVVGADRAIYASVWNNQTLQDWTRVGTGLARAGTSVTAVPTGNGMIALFVIGTDNQIYTSTGSPSLGWTNWPVVQAPNGTVLASGSTPQVTVLPDTSGGFTLFYVGFDQGIDVVSGNAQGWIAAPPFGGAARADTAITALRTADGHLELFVVGTDSNIYTNLGSLTGPWFGWEPVPGATAGANTWVTAARVGGEFYLFLTGPGGEVLDTSGSY